MKTINDNDVIIIGVSLLNVTSHLLPIHYKTSVSFFFSIRDSEHGKAFEKVLPISKPSKVQIHRLPSICKSRQETVA